MTVIRHILVVLALVSGASVSYGVDLLTGAPANKLDIAVDSVMFRDDVTRVYCRILGRPHTSQRIDCASLIVNGTELNGTDIDGVDFERYFQWEDDGCIPLEIDFAPTRESDKIQVKLLTVRGVASSPSVTLRNGKAVR